PALGDEAGELQDPQFVVQRLQGRRPGPAALEPQSTAMERLPQDEPRYTANARDLGHVNLRVDVLQHQRIRPAAPVEPAAEVVPRQSRRWYVVPDDDLRVVQAGEQAGPSQAAEDLVVLARR